MKNSEKYKSAEERDRAFKTWCNEGHNEKKFRCADAGCVGCAFLWLDMEDDMEKILPCPFCGGECVVSSHSEGYNVNCSSRYCYIGKTFESRNEAIAAHNRVARAVMAEK